MQSRMMSAAESLTNIAIGYLISLLATAMVLPAFGYNVTGSDAVGISAVFTVISLVRSYAIRRAFNFRHIRKT